MCAGPGASVSRSEAASGRLGRGLLLAWRFGPSQGRPFEAWPEGCGCGSPEVVFSSVRGLGVAGMELPSTFSEEQGYLREKKSWCSRGLGDPEPSPTKLIKATVIVEIWNVANSDP